MNIQDALTPADQNVVLFSHFWYLLHNDLIQGRHQNEPKLLPAMDIGGFLDK